MRRVLFASALFLSACPAADPLVCTGDTLFGRPNQKTGLSAEQCQPTCTCGGEPWTAPSYGEADVERLLGFTLTAPYPNLEADPYQGPDPVASLPGEVCGVRVQADRSYRTDSYASAEAAAEAGARVTHSGHCGRCSTLADLATYMRHPDLTEPVRACGLKNLFGTRDEHLACLTALGFTRPCAQIWYYNTRHTRQVCADECFAALDASYQTPDGALNPCLACDEVKSGPVFKAVAGRTRRNTGLASAICRPCAEVQRLDHDY